MEEIYNRCVILILETLRHKKNSHNSTLITRGSY